MESKPITGYIYLGTSLRFLQDQTNADLIKGEGRLLEIIDAFFNHLDRLGLHITKRASVGLRTFADKVKDKERLGPDDITELRTLMEKIRFVLFPEATGKFTYILTDKRYEVEKLTNSIGTLFKAGRFDTLDSLAKLDFSEAGKCIAFARSTAAAFHILRGTENVIKRYHGKFIKKASTTGYRTWGQMTTDLVNYSSSKKRGKKPDPILVQNLIHIKDSYRNPTAHPDKNYDIDEVQDLLNLCIEAVNRMTENNELKKP